jgi:hypothetical protein
MLTGEARADLPADLPPGDECTVTIAIRTPSAPGRSALEVGLLQEDVAWFDERGSPSTVNEIDIEEQVSELPPMEPAAHTDEPPMEMYATPAHEVTRWVNEAGGRVVDIAEIVSAGREFFDAGFEGALFAVTRDP